MATGKKIPQDSFFDLSFDGRVPALLRKIADRIETGEVNADRIESSVTHEEVDIRIRIGLHPK